MRARPLSKLGETEPRARARAMDSGASTARNSRVVDCVPFAGAAVTVYDS